MAELSSGRALSGSTINPQNMTIEMCMDYCTERNFPYAGLEYSQECYCSLKPHKDSTPTPNAECSSPCKGNAKLLCGGSKTINVWHKDGGGGAATGRDVQRREEMLPSTSARWPTTTAAAAALARSLSGHAAPLSTPPMLPRLPGLFDAPSWEGR
ncbi:hypothetical protein RB594_008154 [Gaeumannomyces avenae]